MQTVIHTQNYLRDLIILLKKMPGGNVLILHFSKFKSETLKLEFKKNEELKKFSFHFASLSTPLLTLENLEFFHQDPYQKQQMQIIIGIGGGIILDSMKILKHFFFPLAQLVAIPTTAGTGSEATRFATFYDDQKNKQSLTSDAFLAEHVLLDPHWLIHLPFETKMYSLMDAFSQAMESFWSRQATKESEEDALKSLELILENSDQYFQQPNNLEVLTKMITASYLAGRAINISTTTLAHALSYTLTGEFLVPHGLAVFLGLPAVILFNFEKDFIPLEKKEKLFRLFQVNGAFDLAKKVVHTLKVPNKIQDYYPTEELLIRYLAKARQSVRSLNNPRPLLDEKDLLPYVLRF